MQGGGTIVAAAFAIMAYVTRRRPDIARRDSETAQLVMRTASRLESAALNARHVSYLFPSLHEEEKKEMLVSAFVRLQSCYAGRASASASPNKRRHYLHGRGTKDIRPEGGSSIAALDKSVPRGGAGIFDAPKLGRTQRHVYWVISLYEWLERSAMVLGQLQTTIGPESPEDGYAVSLRSSGDELRSHLSQWL